MFKKKDQTEVEEPPEAPKPKHEAAYEDSWYRSLKAMADTLGVENSDEDEEKGSED